MTVSHTLSLDFEGLTLAAGYSFILVSEGMFVKYGKAKDKDSTPELFFYLPNVPVDLFS